MRIFARTDIILAVFITLSFGAVSGFAYKEIQQTAGSGEVLISSIPNGERHYKLITPSGCIGYLNTSMIFHDDQYQLTAKGDVTLSYQGRTLNPTLDFVANFNSIGQLGATRGDIRGAGGWVRFGSVGIDPMQLKLRVVLDQTESSEYETLIPGPALLKYNPDKTFRVEYLQFGKVVGAYRDQSLPPAIMNFIPKIEVGNNADECKGKERSAFDITLLQKVFSLAPLSGLIGG